jgi:hypothetical protein
MISDSIHEIKKQRNINMYVLSVPYLSQMVRKNIFLRLILRHGEDQLTPFSGKELNSNTPAL